MWCDLGNYWLVDQVSAFSLDEYRVSFGGIFAWL